MLTSKERIIETLEIHSGGICDDCLSDLADVQPRQQVNMICSALTSKGTLSRSKHECAKCGKTKLGNQLTHKQFLSSASAVNECRASYSSTAKASPMDVSERLDSFRRNIIQVFNKIDKEKEGAVKERESFSDRLTRLADCGDIPAAIEAMMRFINNVRNICVYEECKLQACELDIIERAWQVIADWQSKAAN